MLDNNHPQQVKPTERYWWFVSHGMSYTAEYRAWIRMISRCENPKANAYHRYGGRGIKVCRRWRESFMDFYKDMGRQPSRHHSLDRFPDNDGDYEPGNCRWATRHQQNVNKSNNVFLEHQGRRMTLSEWAKVAGVSPAVFAARIKNGWPIQDAMSTPVKRIRAGEDRVLLDHDGRSMTVFRWAAELGVSGNMINHRLKAGWSVHDTLTIPSKRAASRAN